MDGYEFVGELFNWDTINVNATDLLYALKTVWAALGDIWVTFGAYSFNLQDGAITILVASAVIEFFGRVIGLKVGLDMGEARIVD